MVLYLACTPDKYELPVFVTDTADEMAAFMGVTRQIVWQMVSRKRKYERDGNMLNGGRFHLFRVELGEKERTCPNCGTRFERRQHQQIYCSTKCRRAMAYTIIKKKEG